RGQAWAVSGGEGGVERPHGVHDRQPRPDRPFRVILARGGPAEVDEEAIAEFPGDVAAEAPDGAGGGLLVLRDEVAPLLGVELLRKRRRADQVAEEDRQLPASAGRRRRPWLAARRRDGARPRLGRQPGATAAAELLVGLVRSATRRAGRGERGPAFPAESALGAVVVVAGRAAHRGVSPAR